MPLKYTGFLLDDAKEGMTWRDDADKRVSDMADCGTNIFRICVFPSRAANACDYTLSDAVLSLCDQHVAMAEKYNMICVFAFFLPGADAGSKDGAMWKSASLQASFGALWKSFAQRYWNKPVWFDLLNEPVYYGDAVPERESPYAAIFQQWGEQVRSVARNPILWQPSPGGMAHTFNYAPPNLSNLIGSVHWYWPYNVTHNGVGREFDARWIYPNRGPDQVLNPDVLYQYGQGSLETCEKWCKQYHLPMVVGEFSCIRWAPEQSHVRYIADSLGLFERMNFDGWIYCAWRCWYGWDPENEATDTPADADFDETHRYANPYWDVMSVLRRHMQLPAPQRVLDRPPPLPPGGPPAPEDVGYRRRPRLTGSRLDPDPEG